jgi:hypothetical protein
MSTYTGQISGSVGVAINTSGTFTLPSAPAEIQYGIMSLWCFESNGMTIDKYGRNTLVASGNPVLSTEIFAEGESSLQLNSVDSQYLSISDSNLSQDFPLKLGDQNRVFSTAFWFFLNNEEQQTILQKGNSIRIYTLDSHLYISYGHTDGLLDEIFVLPFQINLGEWYHLFLSIDGRNMKMVVGILNRNTMAQSVFNTSLLHEVSVNDNDFIIGASDASEYLSGNLDEVYIFNTMLTPSDQIEIVNKIYGFSDLNIFLHKILQEKTGWKWNENYWR